MFIYYLKDLLLYNQPIIMKKQFALFLNLKEKICFKRLLFLTLIGFASTLAAQNSLPVINNITYQDNVATNTITINYELFDAEDDEMEVLLQASYNNGEQYFIKTITAQGDVGFPVKSGNRTIEWYYGDEIDVVVGKTLRLVADDKYQISVQELVDQVDENRLKQSLSYIAQPRSFQSAPEHLYDVRDSIAALFESYELQVRQQKFSYEQYTGTNVIGRKQGIRDERKTFIMDAHYDGYLTAPGADDNGSGVVGFLEAARILSQYEFDKSLEFIGFDSEENFLLGSINYAFFGGIESWKNVQGVFNYEMIGYYSEENFSQEFPAGFDILFPAQYEELIADSFKGNFIFLVANDLSVPLVNAFDKAAGDYVQDLKIIAGVAPLNAIIAPDLLRSDHAPFWFKNIPALMITDGAEFRNKCYHTNDDKIEKIDFKFLGDVTRTCLAAMAEEAGLRHATAESFLVERQVITNLQPFSEACQVALYPNPTSKEIYITKNDCLLQFDKLNVSIFDVKGQLVRSFIMASNQQRVEIDDLSNGVYTLTLKHDNKSQTIQFVVQD